jgi:hypothetical protein
MWRRSKELMKHKPRPSATSKVNLYIILYTCVCMYVCIHIWRTREGGARPARLTYIIYYIYVCMLHIYVYIYIDRKRRDGGTVLGRQSIYISV